MEAVFASTRQAVHMAFVVMSQPMQQDALLRRALIRVMESTHLDGQRREWLEQLRGAPSSTVNFAGLTGDEVRAQCAMVTQAVAQLPSPEAWVIQARYGYVEFEDVTDGEVAAQQLQDALDSARAEAERLRISLRAARVVLDSARDQYLAYEGRVAPPAAAAMVKEQYHAARDQVRDVSAALGRAESTERQVQIAMDRARGNTLTDGVSLAPGQGGRRFAFSAERIDAIKGLSAWLHPSFPRIKPLALDCMLGRLFANHQRIGISFRDLAQSFGGSAMLYQRASFKLLTRVRELEEAAFRRLECGFVAQGVAWPIESD